MPLKRTPKRQSIKLGVLSLSPIKSGAHHSPYKHRNPKWPTQEPNKSAHKLLVFFWLKQLPISLNSKCLRHEAEIENLYHPKYPQNQSGQRMIILGGIFFFFWCGI